MVREFKFIGEGTKSASTRKKYWGGGGCIPRLRRKGKEWTGLFGGKLAPNVVRCVKSKS
jgi:hypothetical protein